MFGLPKGTKLDFLIGCALEQIVFSPFQLILHFSRSVELSLESQLELQDPYSNAAILVWEPNRFSELPRIAAIFGSPVVKYEIPGDGRLILHFENGNVLTAHDSNKNHESYQLSGGGVTVIV